MKLIILFQLLLVLSLSSAALIRLQNATSINSHVARTLTYEITAGDFSCAAANVKNQDAVAPSWYYTQVGERLSRDSTRRDPIPNAWEPILEPVTGCNGLKPGWLKEFRFTAVLDRSWVRYYHANSQYFATQGYASLEASVQMLAERVDYLFRHQFGISIRLSQVIALADLEHSCIGEEGLADSDGSTLRALRAAGFDTLETNANLLRFGTAGDVCSSYADGAADLGDRNGLAVMMEKPFTDDGRMRYDAPQALAHELGHLFGVCLQNNAHCLNGHTANEFPDIMVWEPWVYGPHLPHGYLFKFLTTCTPVYRDLLCKKARGTARSANLAPVVT